MQIKLVFTFFLIICFIGLIISSNDAYAAVPDTWTDHTCNYLVGTSVCTVPTNGIIKGVSMADANNGVAVGNLNGIVYTTNGGVTWTISSSAVGSNVVYGVSMTDASNGVAVGNRGTIVYTTNGGVTWTAATHPITASNPADRVLTGVSMGDANNGVAVGFGGAKILRTTNGGLDWTEYSSGFGTGHMYGVSMGDANNGVAVGNSGKIVYTTNGGVTWDHDTTDASNGIGTNVMYGVSMTDANNGVAVGSSGTIVHTDDGGVTWTATTTPSVAAPTMFGVSMTDANNGVAVGSRAIILYTDDGGVTWTAATTTSIGSPADRTTVTGVSMSSASNGVAVGYSGEIVFAIGTDTTAPTLSITSSDGADSDVVSDNTLSFTATFSEATSNFVIGDITVSGSANGNSPAASNFVAVSNIVYTFDVIKGSSDGTVAVTVAANVATDSAGNDNTVSNTFDFTIDTTAPTFTVTSVSPTSGNTAKVGDSVVVTLTAGSSETGLTASGTQTINGVTSSFSESGGGVYTITYTVVEGNTDRSDSGTLPVSITLKDAAGNAGTEITTIASGTAPGVDANSPIFSSAGTTSTTQIAITVDQTVSNNSASAGDFTLGGVSGGSINSVSVSGTTITLGITGATIADTDTVTIAYTQSSGSVDDVNGHSLQNFSAQSVTNNLDTTAPTIAFTSVTPTSGTQVVGQTVVVRVTAGSSETGLTLSTSNINGVTPTFNEVGSGVYDLTYTIVQGNTDIVDASAGVPYSIILNDANGNPSNTLAATISTGSSPGVDANSPTIAFTSVTPTSGTQVVGQTVVVRVTAGSSETGLTLSTSNINGVTPTFNEVGSGVYDLTYTIVQGNTDIVDASAGVPYSIILNDANGNPSNTLAATISTGSSPGVAANPPSKVGTVTPTTGSGQVTLSWNAPSANGTPITDYIIQYSTDNSSWSTFADGTSTGTTATVTGLTNNTVYYFKVAAVSGGGTGSYSNSASANAGAPSQVIISTTVESGTSTSLSWSAPADGGSSITDYIIQYSTDNSSWSTFADGTSTSTSVTITGLSNCNDYYYRVSGVNGIGTGIVSSNSQNTLDVDSNYNYEGRGVQDFTTKQQFGSSVLFEFEQTFGVVQEFGDTQIFGAGNKFANSQNFCGTHNFIADAIEFGTTTVFDTAQTFGNAAKFAANQDFTNVNHDFTANAVFFDSGGVFSASEVMGVGADFSSGIQIFGNAMTFDEATEFGDLQDWGTQTHTFEKYMHFGDTNDFADKIQTFNEGTSFGDGTIFKDNQSVPINTIPSFGMLLQTITCGTATSSETCMPNDATKYLSPGEFLTAGQDPAATSISISKNNKGFSVDGIGLEMTFADITTDGTIESDLYDPANIPSSTLVGGTGKVSVSTSNVGTVETIGSVMNISTGTSSVSGDITISLKYSEDNIPAGTAESELTMLHYTGGAWKTEDSCTVDTVNNKITCTVTGLSPFGIGGKGSGASSSSSSSSGGGGGKNNCDSNEFGNSNSLKVYQVMYDIDTYQVLVQAYSTCGSISAKMTTPMQQSILGLSTEQTLLDDRVAIYSGHLDESDKKFTISVQNNRDSFDETFYIYDKSIIKKYTGSTGYTSEQQGLDIISTQTTILTEPSPTTVSPTIEESISIENPKQIVIEKLIVEQTQSVEYTPEPVIADTSYSPCGPGTESVNGICKVIETTTIETSEGGGCLIATATYGSELSPQVQQLRELRDNQLLNTESGTAFMAAFNDVYYSFSPIIADYERENPLFKEAVKLAITPMISSLSLMENANSESEVLGMGLSVIMLNIGMYLGVPAVVIVGIRKNL